MFAAFLASVALGGFVSLQKHATVEIEAKSQSCSAAYYGVSSDPVEQSLGAMTEYRQACEARACGRCVEAQRRFTILAKSPNLNSAQREFCRNAMRRDRSIRD